ncbi:MAG: hypothetical protein AB8G26_18765 [Ilumatobacter sp.]
MVDVVGAVVVDSVGDADAVSGSTVLGAADTVGVGASVASSLAAPSGPHADPSANAAANAPPMEIRRLFPDR